MLKMSWAVGAVVAMQKVMHEGMLQSAQRNK